MMVLCMMYIVRGCGRHWGGDWSSCSGVIRCAHRNMMRHCCTGRPRWMSVGTSIHGGCQRRRNGRGCHVLNCWGGRHSSRLMLSMSMQFCRVRGRRVDSWRMRTLCIRNGLGIVRPRCHSRRRRRFRFSTSASLGTSPIRFLQHPGVFVWCSGKISGHYWCDGTNDRARVGGCTTSMSCGRFASGIGRRKRRHGRRAPLTVLS
mmetsp:Transcript_5092/g.10402  ORF Transcript_5092/g.10402 Transcript_5092/m.10402 type:complete len:203 (-) Transcript_5092:244-852(-)